MADLLLKTCAPFEVKALDEEARTFEGLASTWDQDLGGDVIHRGAFKRTLSHWKRSKRALPLIDQHNYGSVRAVIGKMESAEETDAGLLSTFSIIDGPDGDEILRRVKGGLVDGLSIGYRAVKIEMPTPEEELAGVWRHLKEVELREVSVVIWPMNTGATIDTSSVKSMLRLARGRDLTEDEKAELSRIRTELGALLDAPPAGDGTAAKGLAPGDPGRLEAEAVLRTLRLANLRRPA